MNIVFFGDSVTEGCFEIVTVNGKIEILRDKSACYATRLVEMLNLQYSDFPLTFFNAGISGDSTQDGLNRMQTQVLEKKPNLVILCFGLNDISYRNPEVFANRLGEMFRILRERSIPVIYLTPNMLNTYVSPSTHESVLAIAKDCADCQNSGLMDQYVAAGIKKAQEYGVYVADAYSEWKRLSAYGVDTTELLCNRINHPSRKMHALFADTLFNCIQKNHLLKEEHTV